MNVTGAALQSLKRFASRLSPRSVSVVIALLVFAVIITVRHAGYLQFLEFKAYDYFIRKEVKAPTSEPIVLVELTEEDIHSPSLDYPIYDDKLAKILSNLAADKPAVIGLDIWRDIPVPKSGIYADQLTQVLLSNSNIVAIFTLGGVAPPAALKSYPDRLAFNDNFLIDLGVDLTVPKVRRSLLFSLSSAGDILFSFPFRLATCYLERQGIGPEVDPADPKVCRLGKGRFQPFQANDAEYVGADAGGTQLLLDFKCPDYFRRFTLSQALEGKIPPGSLKDKIVLLGINTASAGGTNTASVLDERVTPIRQNDAGMEVQAMAVNQILRYALEGGKQLRFWSDWQEDAWILLWCLIGTATGCWIRSPWTLTVVNLLCLLAGGLFSWMAFQDGLWIPLVTPLLAFLPASGLVVSYISFHENRERGQLMQLFSKQVSPDIAQALWEQRHEFLAGHRPRPQKLTATVLFTDLVGFTAISEKLDPAQLMDWLNEYMEAMANIIMAHHGVVEKYIGDAIMAVFGAPLSRSKESEFAGDARNAVRCALAMAEKLEELNRVWTERGLRRAGMRVGIHTGSLVAGSLGSADRQEYTVIGDTVNTASRLESYKESSESGRAEKLIVCRILISEATHELTSGNFEVVNIGSINLKNKAEPVMIYRVLSGIPNTQDGADMNTKTNHYSKVACLLAGTLLCGAALQLKADNSTSAPPAQVKFRPQTTGAPSVRVTGGSRGVGDTSITLDILAPDDTGITTLEQPSLFWYQSKPAKAKFELTLLQENKVKPLVQVMVERSTQAGIQRLKLSDKGTKLSVGVEYQWVVALVTDPENRSRDLVASGVIKRIEPTADLKAKVAKATPDSLAGVYAEAGIWYDALAAISDRIDADPENKALRQARVDLLSQVGLKAAASAERASVTK